MNLDPTSITENQEAQNVIISKVRDLINYKNLEPGDKLPSERVLSEKFGVSRRNINEAIEKLESYELVKSIPQTGTFVAHIGPIALNGIIDDILSLEQQDFKSLVETRIFLELKIASLAAKRRSDEDLKQIEEKLLAYKTKLLNREDALQEDMLFHLAIAKASGNSTMNELMLQITPKIISIFANQRVCNKEEFLSEIQVHVDIFEAIRDKKPAQAMKAVEKHFKLLSEFCETIADK